MDERSQPYFLLREVRDYDVRARKRAIQDQQITPRDSDLIEQYLSEKQAVDQIGRHRVLKINTILLGWRENFLRVEYAQVTFPDLVAC